MKIGIIIVAVVILLVVLWVVFSYNSLVKKKLKVEESFSTMDVYLKKRFDLIPNLVATVKGYAKHETETLEKVIAERNSGVKKTTAENIQDENSISGALRQIFALTESYPDLKANTNFMNLMEQLKRIEEEIANSRKYYNAIVKEFNVAVMTVPTNIVASIFHFEKQQMFVVDSNDERKNVEVNFD